MPFWVWIFLAVCIGYGALVLWRAGTKSFVKFGPIQDTKDDNPILFWFLVAGFCMCEIWCVGMLVLVAISLISGPIFSQR